MKIIQDFQIFIRQTYGGISRYHYELNRNLVDLGEDSSIFAIFPICKYMKDRRVYRYSNKIIRNMIYVVNEIALLVVIVARSFCGKSVDILHITWYKNFYIRLFYNILGKRRPKLIITIYDLIHEMVQNDIPIMRKGVRDKRYMLDKADGIICISENTKKDLLKYYPEVVNKSIKVIRLGVDDEYIKPEKVDVQGKYILYVGGRDGYKNFNRFINAAAAILHSKPGYCVFCAGGGAFTTQELDLLDDLEIGDKVFQSSVSEGELVYLYKNAECFVFPSLYEGFGIPILEAFKYECPLIIHNGSCFPEIAGDSAEYFDGNDIESISSSIKKVLDDTMYKDLLVNRGKERLTQYSWDKTARATRSFYQSVLGI